MPVAKVKHLLNLHNHSMKYSIVTIIIPIKQMRRLMLRKVRCPGSHARHW